MTKRKDEETIEVVYAYDAVNRVTERKKSGASTDIQAYTYDALGRLVTADKGVSGNSDAVSRSVFGYDALSRVLSESQAIAEGTAQDADYTYDASGNRQTLQHDDGGLTVAYAYDTRDRCTKIENGGATLADYTWLGGALSKRDTTCDYPGGTQPKFKTDFLRDGLLRVTKVVNQHVTDDMDDAGYSDLGTFEYGYDRSSNALSTLQTATMDELDADRYYEYDTLNRLLTARLTDTQDWDAAAEATTSYDYDELGNRYSHTYRGAGSIAYEHDKANRMTKLAGNDQLYDKAGNLTLAYSADRATSYKYKYDHNNRLIGIYDDGGTTQSAAFAYDALGRRIEFIDDKPATSATTRYYYYDGVNEIVETDQSANNRRTYVHGISYVDERLMMKDFGDPAGGAGDDRPYYYVIDRMYNVRFIVDRAGAIVERYCYDPYGRPLIRESAGRGDMDNDTDMDSTDSTRLLAVYNGTKWDPRADMDDDGDVDATDRTLYNSKNDNWPPQSTATVVAQAFSDVGNPFGFQGRVHFAIDTASDATDATLFLVDHRWRFNDPVTARWLGRDPQRYTVLVQLVVVHDQDLSNRHWDYRPESEGDWPDHRQALNLYEYLGSNAIIFMDPNALAWWNWFVTPITKARSTKRNLVIADKARVACLAAYANPESNTAGFLAWCAKNYPSLGMPEFVDTAKAIIHAGDVAHAGAGFGECAVRVGF